MLLDQQLLSARIRFLNMKHRGLITVAGGILVHLSLGSIYTFGNMLPYIASYIAYKNGNTQDDYQYYVQQCSYIFAFTLASQV